MKAMGCFGLRSMRCIFIPMRWEKEMEKRGKGHERKA